MLDFVKRRFCLVLYSIALEGIEPITIATALLGPLSALLPAFRTPISGFNGKIIYVKTKFFTYSVAILKVYLLLYLPRGSITLFHLEYNSSPSFYLTLQDKSTRQVMLDLIG